MRALIDTHAFIWFAEGDQRLPAYARALIEDMSNDITLSMASVWEMSIKEGLGKLRLKCSLADFLARELTGFNLLHIEVAHAIAAASLPHHHRDPFDRMLAAQSLAEQIPIVSGDAVFEAYGVTRLWDGP